MPIAQFTKEGLILLPEEIRKKAGITFGDTIDVRLENGVVTIRPVKDKHVEDAPSFLAMIVGIAEEEDYPTDLSTNHDKYIYNG